MPRSTPEITVIGAGFSGEAVVRRLEYRAQLVALCETPDARLPLAMILLAAEGSTGPTAHGAAYRELLIDFLDQLARSFEQSPQALPELDPAYHLTHQLHHLRSDSVRAIARSLARVEGLDVWP